ncbi:hypothetical protein ACMFMG_011168 [Clarireedia jacksonii]
MFYAKASPGAPSASTTPLFHISGIAVKLASLAIFVTPTHLMQLVSITDTCQEFTGIDPDSVYASCGLAARCDDNAKWMSTEIIEKYTKAVKETRNYTAEAKPVDTPKMKKELPIKIAKSNLNEMDVAVVANA